MSSAHRETFVTPEAVALPSDIAGLGSRAVAAILDGLIQFGVTVVVFAALAGVRLNLTQSIVVFAVTAFVMLWVYPIVFEGAWRGQTPGKRAARIRVVRTDGTPVGLGAVLVRNLLRIIDFLPTTYAVGAVTMLLTRRAQRLGDLAAGTMVVHAAPPPAPQPLVLAVDEARDRLAEVLDTAALTPRDQLVVRSFLARRGTLSPAARAGLAEDIASRLRGRVPGDVQGADAETFLEAVVEAYRRRMGFAAAPADPPQAGAP